MALLQPVLQPGDTILGMNLADGGHLTHGSKVNFSGKLYNMQIKLILAVLNKKYLIYKIHKYLHLLKRKKVRNIYLCLNNYFPVQLVEYVNLSNLFLIGFKKKLIFKSLPRFVLIKV